MNLRCAFMVKRKAMQKISNLCGMLLSSSAFSCQSKQTGFQICIAVSFNISIIGSFQLIDIRAFKPYVCLLEKYWQGLAY